MCMLLRGRGGTRLTFASFFVVFPYRRWLWTFCLVGLPPPFARLPSHLRVGSRSARLARSSGERAFLLILRTHSAHLRFPGSRARSFICLLLVRILLSLFFIIQHSRLRQASAAPAPPTIPPWQSSIRLYLIYIARVCAPSKRGGLRCSICHGSCNCHLGVMDVS